MSTFDRRTEPEFIAEKRQATQNIGLQTLVAVIFVAGLLTAVHARECASAGDHELPDRVTSVSETPGQPQVMPGSRRSALHAPAA